MSKIEISELVNMSEGNPGALQVLLDLLEEGGHDYILKLKELGITSWKIWNCYSDICKRDIGLLKKKILDGTLLDELKETRDWKYREEKNYERL